MIAAITFYLLASVILASALCVVLLRNVVHSALFLGLCLAGVAGVFASLGADFISAAQVLIYVSGIAVLILFVVMLSGRTSDLLMRQVNEQWPAALVICGTLLFSTLRFLKPLEQAQLATPMSPTTDALGRLLLGDLAFPFELISIVLMVALVGAVYFSKTDVGGAKEAVKEEVAA